MIDRALGFSAPESYYFQLYPVNLVLLSELVPSPETKFKFSIYKGLQKFDQNKIMTDANFINTDGTYVMPFRGCQLNFYLPNFNKNRKIIFTLKLNEKESNEEYEIGAIDIDPANFINEFQNNGQNRFEQKIQISQQYALQFEVYLQKSRFALQKVVKSFQGQRTMKSPVRQRTSPVIKQKTSPVIQRNSQLKEGKSPQRQILIQEIEPIQKSNTKSYSRVEETVEQQEKQIPIQKKLSEQTEDKPIGISNPLANEQQKPQNNSNEKSEKSETIVSPMVRTKQMKRTSGRNQSTIRGSQRLSKETGEQIIIAKQKNDADSWVNHLPLVVFTIFGILAIYWVMHPTNRA